VLRELPKAHPIFDGFTWELSPETRAIVSTFYGKRYEVHLHPRDRARRAAWRAQSDGSPTSNDEPTAQPMR
jgi:hypothetical protein